MRVLLVGATGFIGSAVLARLVSDGHFVRALARRQTRQTNPGVEWAALDIRNATIPDAWSPHLRGIDAVVYCVGVLQDNREDSTDVSHRAAPSALYAACAQAGVKRVIHFSAIGVDRETPTDFSRTKMEGDARLMAEPIDWVILRPSVVVGRAAFGGSALFRGLAALPVVPRFEEAGKIQVVQLDDVVETVMFFLSPSAPGRVCLEIAGPARLSFDEIIAAYRRWLGWPPAPSFAAPERLMRAMYRLGDFAGWLGWRPPIRSTAEREILRGATGDISQWVELTHISPKPLQQALSEEPAGVQERWFARLYFVKPVIFTVFSLFWISTALMSLGPGWGIGVGLMHEGGVTGVAAPLTVIAGALSDLVIGIGIAFRRTTRLSLLAALALSLTYVVIGTTLVSRLWIDPLGPMLKIWPIVTLNLAALAIYDDR